MILSAKKVLELNEKYQLVEGLSERELNNPEGVEVELRVGEIYALTSEGYLGVENRKSPDIEKVADIKEDKEYIVQPGEYVLVKTIEIIHSPAEKVEVEPGRSHYLMPTIYPRSTLQRCGVLLRSTTTNPGYKGELTFGLVNLNKFPFRLELGTRICKLVFAEVVGELARTYSGQWAGGRVSTKTEEKQN
jgi:dCTP deaminase